MRSQIVRAHPVIRAALWTGGALLSFVLMAVAGRELSKELGIFEILTMRSLIGLIVTGALVGRWNFRQLATRRAALHLMRNVSHFVGQYGWFYGIAFIPLAEVFAIEFTSPVWTAILASLFLGERLTKARITAIACGLAGVLLILRPGFAVIHVAVIAVLIGSLGYAVSHVLTKKLSATEKPLTILFYMSVVQFPLGLVPASFNWITPTAPMWPWLLAVGLTSLTAHYCFARAFLLADATVVVPLDFLRLPLGAVSGYLLYGESVESIVYAGAAVIVFGNLSNIYSERAKKPAT